MSGPSTVKEVPVERREQLVAFIAEGEKPREAWRIGTEHEKFAFRLDDLRSLPFEGERASIRALLEGMTRFDWQPVYEEERPRGGARGNRLGTQVPRGRVGH